MKQGTSSSSPCIGRQHRAGLALGLVVLCALLATVATFAVAQKALAAEALGSLKTLVGTSGSAGFAGDGSIAASPDVKINTPFGIAIDPQGNVFFADKNNCRIRQVSELRVQSVAGTGDCVLGADGSAQAASFKDPEHLLLLPNGGLLISETTGCRIRLLLGGNVSTIAGTGVCAIAPDGSPATVTTLHTPEGLASDGDGNVYFAERPAANGCRVRRIAAETTIVSTIAGTGVCSYSGDGGLAEEAALDGPQGVAVDAAGNMFVTEHCAIRRVDGNTSIITTVAGTGVCGFNGDGQPAAGARVDSPEAVVVAPNGDLYFADTDNCRIRRVRVTDSYIETVAGTGSCTFSGDGHPAMSLPINRPSSVAVTAQGDILFSDIPHPNSSGEPSHAVRAVCGSDADSDGANCMADNCPIDGNPLQDNNDGNFIDTTGPLTQDDASRVKSDAAGDVCDDDDDNDGLDDADEQSLPGAACPAATGVLDAMHPDSDGDGYMDGAECAIGTNPNNPSAVPVGVNRPTADQCRILAGAATVPTDTDGDLIQDRIEVCGYGTSVSSQESDGDGREDQCEIASLNTLPAVNSGDQLLLSQAIVADLSGPFVWNADLNKDGANNSGDQLLMATIITGGGCPAS